MATKDITDFQVLRAYEERAKNILSPAVHEILAQQTGQCVKVCFHAMDRVHRRGLIEYGVSVRSAWLTEEGKKLLEEKQDEE